MIYALAIIVAVSGPVLAASPVAEIAGRSGEAVGAAAACGVPNDELIAFARTFIRGIRQAATSDEELQRAQAAHEAGVQRGSDEVRRAGAAACPAAIERFRALARGT